MSLPLPTEDWSHALVLGGRRPPVSRGVVASYLPNGTLPKREMALLKAHRAQQHRSRIISGGSLGDPNSPNSSSQGTGVAAADPIAASGMNGLFLFGSMSKKVRNGAGSPSPVRGSGRILVGHNPTENRLAQSQLELFSPAGHQQARPAAMQDDAEAILNKLDSSDEADDVAGAKPTSLTREALSRLGIQRSQTTTPQLPKPKSGPPGDSELSKSRSSRPIYPPMAPQLMKQGVIELTALRRRAVESSQHGSKLRAENNNYNKIIRELNDEYWEFRQKHPVSFSRSNGQG